MKYWVGVTDNHWFSFLSKTDAEEVNFWQPRGRVALNHLQPGSLFLFKLKKPYNHIAGGGYFVKSLSLPLSLAWEAFGQKNGAASKKEFEGMITKLSNDPANRDPEIGCTIITQPFFWPQELWIPDPAEFAGSIVRGKYYEATEGAGHQIFDAVQQRLDKSFIKEVQGHLKTATELNDRRARYGAPMQITPRLGQGSFRAIVTDVYQRKCAMTGENILPVLEAAHILPYSEGGPHDVTNGLLLRSDFHKLFDIGLVTLTPDYKIQVSPKIHEQWFNGKAYYRLHNQSIINLPQASSEQPNKYYLDWHNKNIFQAS